MSMFRVMEKMSPKWAEGAMGTPDGLRERWRCQFGECKHEAVGGVKVDGVRYVVCVGCRDIARRTA